MIAAPIPPRTYNYLEARSYLGISLRKLETLVHDGEVRVIRIGRRVLFREEDLDDYLDAQARGGAPHKGRP